MYFVYFFFFKQTTAYEMRISDWSSDVCSSDLFEVNPFQGAIQVAGAIIGVVDDDDGIRAAVEGLLQPAGFRVVTFASATALLSSMHLHMLEIGRASCRERVCQYV